MLPTGDVVEQERVIASCLEGCIGEAESLLLASEVVGELRRNGYAIEPQSDLGARMAR
jgi:hypothetical protein